MYFDTPEHIMNEICELGNIKRDAFNSVTNQIIAEETDEKFANFLCECLGTHEFQIYRAATKIATSIELSENAYTIQSTNYGAHLQGIENSLQPYMNIPGVKEIKNIQGDIFQVFKKIASLRNKNRWAAQSYLMECSVLGHLFDTAIFAYIMSLEINENDEATAAELFFAGIFHDIAETWTTDIPSPIKDRIKGFRKATEEYENIKLEAEFYSKLPDFVVAKIKSIIMEDLSTEKFKIVKGADYLSADSECWRQYKAGSRDEYFLGAMLRRKKGIEEGTVALTPVCTELYNYFVNYAYSLNLEEV